MSDFAESDAPIYRFVKALPESPGFGPGVEVRLRSTGDLLGYVRRIAPGRPGRASWMVYGPDGDERGIADQRTTAANFLRHEHARVNPPGSDGGAA